MIPVGVLGATENIDALLGAVLDQTHDCIKLLDRDGTIRYVNARGAIAMELREPGELLGLDWVARWPADAQAAVQEALEKARSGKVARFTASRKLAGGAPSWWDVTVTPVQSTRTSEHLLVIARDTTAEMEERERAAAIGAEMRHRLRNGMTIAAAIVSMAARGKPELQAFADQVTTRFAQLARTQELILDSSVSKSFAEVMPLVASVYGDVGRIEFGSFPDVKLEDKAIQALALALGELMTNSLKYGALNRGDRIRIGGRLTDDEVEYRWEEETVFAGRREGGQGLTLIDRIVRASGGRVERSFDEQTFVTRVTFPPARR